MFLSNSENLATSDQLSPQAEGRLSPLTHWCQLPTCPWTFNFCGSIPCFILFLLTHPSFLHFLLTPTPCMFASLLISQAPFTLVQWLSMTSVHLKHLESYRSHWCRLHARSWASITSHSSLASSYVLRRVRPPAWPHLGYSRSFLASLLMLLFSVMPSQYMQRQGHTLCSETSKITIHLH